MQDTSTISSLSDLVTIAVAPRERHYSIIPSLLSLFATIPPNIRVIVAQGDIPDDLRMSLYELKKLRNFELIETEFPLYPQEARNLCIESCSSEFVVITDNDIEYEEGWLEAIVQNAITHNSDVVAPLIFIGPPRSTTIHHAGGNIRVFKNNEGLLATREIHRLSHRNIADVDVNALSVSNHTVEFHCFLVRSSYVARTGLFDERLTTQEQIHYGFLARNLGAKVTFEAGARVTYAAKNAFTPKDLEYLSFRWSDAQASESMQAIMKAWGIYFNERVLLAKWIRTHRARAYATFYPEQHKNMALNDFYYEFMQPIEQAALERAHRLRQGRILRYNNPIDPAAIAETLNAFMVRSDRAAPRPAVAPMVSA